MRKMNMKTKKLVLAALMAALICVATMIIKVPSPLKGYMNLGDSIVLVCGWMLSPVYGFLAAGIGSALADVVSGYMTYVPATFIIKGLMAVTAYHGFRRLHKKTGNLLARILSGAIVETVMVLGYFGYEGVLYGFAPSAVNILANSVQGIAGIVVGVALMKVFEKNKMIYE